MIVGAIYKTVYSVTHWASIAGRMNSGHEFVTLGMDELLVSVFAYSECTPHNGRHWYVTFLHLRTGQFLSTAFNDWSAFRRVYEET